MVGVDHAVVPFDDDEFAPGDFGRLDRGHVDAKVSRQAHAEGLVLDGVIEAGDLGLEQVRRRRAVDRPAPRPVGHAGQHQLVLDAGKGDPDPSTDAQGLGSELRHHLLEAVATEGLGGGGRRPWWRLIVRGLDHECSRAVTTERRDQRERVRGGLPQVVSDRRSRPALGEQPVEKWADDSLGVPPGGDRHRQREQRCAQRVVLECSGGVRQSRAPPVGVDDRHTVAVQPHRQLVGHYQSALSKVILTPSWRSTLKSRLTCSVSLPFSSSDR